MRRLYYNFITVSSLMLLASLCVSCNIDDSYDLTNLDTENMGIGTDESQFIMPIAEIELDISTLMGGSTTEVRSVSSSSSSMEDILGIIDDVSLFLPSTLTGDYEDGIDISQLEDSEYTAGLVDILFEELTTDVEAMESLCEYILEQDDSASYVEALNDLLEEDISNYTPEQCAAELSAALLDEEFAAQIDALKESIVVELVVSAADIETSFTLEEDLGNIGIDSSTLSILDQNLDGDSNYIRLLSDVTTNIPFEVVITPKLLYGSQELVIGDIADLYTGSMSGMISSISQLEQILNSFVISAEIDINNYNPANGDLNLEGKSIKIRLVAVKGGSLSLSFNN